jgi:hypothetical protein
MAKKTEVGGLISPTNLWGKPLPNITGSKLAPAKKEQQEERTKRMLADEDDDIDSDVDDELEETEELVTEDGTELLEEDGDDEEAYAEAAAEEAGDDDEEVDGYAPEDGDVAEDGEVEAEEAVDEDPAPVPVTAGAKKKVSNMSEKKSGADHIRDEIAKRKATGDSVRGVDIVAALAKRKIEVSPAQVSQLLKKAGLGGASRGGKKLAAVGEDKSRAANKAKKPVAETTRALPKARPATGAVGTLPMDQLKAASAFLAACGGCYDSAGEILSAHKQLGAMMAH